MTGRAPGKLGKSPDPEAENLVMTGYIKVTLARSLRDFEGRKGNRNQNQNQKQRNLRAERKGKRGERRPEYATPAAGEGERRPKNTLSSAISGWRGAVFGASVAGR